MTTRPLEESFETGMDLRLWRKLFRYTRPYRRQMIGVAAFGTGTAVVDVAFPLVTRRVIDDVVAHGAGANLVPWAGVYLGLSAALALFVIAFIWNAGEIRTSVSHDIRRDGFANLQNLSF